MTRKSTGGPYPPNWKEIATEVKARVNWCCVRCGVAHDPPRHVLTVHHLDMNPANCVWWNLCPLCSRCHLQIQAKVIMRRQWILSHSEWFKPYVAGYYAYINGLPDDMEYVQANVDQLLAIGQGRQ